MSDPNAPNGSHCFRIADVARLSGVSASTLRFWEQHGLITPAYTATGHRLYTDQDIEQVRAIQRLRTVQGLSLAAIRARLDRETPQSTLSTPPVPRIRIGPQLRALRTKMGLSLRDVAARTGLAASFISTLERTSRGASPSSIHKLAACYNTTVTELTAQQEAPQEGLESGVVRADQAPLAPLLGPKIRIEQRARHEAMMDCQKWSLQPGAESEDAYSHDGEEFIYVLRGLLEIRLDGHERHLLYPGDSIYFDSTRLHFWRTPGEEETILLWVNTPPTF